VAEQGAPSTGAAGPRGARGEEPCGQGCQRCIERGSSMSSEQKPILCVDFDGVIHRYDSGWQGATVITDGVVPGFFEWLDEAGQIFQIVVYSSRCRDPGACDAMANWL